VTARVREVLAVLDDHNGYLSSPPGRLRRHLAAAGLGRCRALLESVCILCEHGRTDTLGVLVRAIFEVWLVALYTLHKGKDDDDESVIIELRKDYEHHASTIVDKVGLGPSARAKVDGWKADTLKRQPPGTKPPPQKLRYDKIAEQLTDILPGLDPSQSHQDVAGWYDRLYRGESTYSAHPGLGLLLRYVKWGKEGAQNTVIANPGRTFPAQERIAAMLTIILAQHVYQAFGIVADPRLDALFLRLAPAPDTDD